jgi:exodeoxyribonuclease V alpha subunit
MSTPTPHSVAYVLIQLTAWVDAACLRMLDAALARFVHTLSAGQASPALLLASALTAHMEGRGHSCFELTWLNDPDAHAFMHWPSLQRHELGSLLSHWPADWTQTLLDCRWLSRPDAPLVLSGSRLYLRRYWQMERSIMQQLQSRLQTSLPVNSPRVHQQLGRLFAPRPDGEFDSQKLACALALRSRVSLITGGPGTGKTYTAARLLALLYANHPQPETLRIGLSAPTGKAAARLRQAIDSALTPLQTLLYADAYPKASPSQALPWPSPSARTLHAWLGAQPQTRQLRHHSQAPLPLDIMIVDEASMLHLEMLCNLLEALPPDAHLILMGDAHQLASVEAGAVLRDLCRGSGRYSASTAAYVLACTGQPLPASHLHSMPDHTLRLAEHTTILQHSHRFAGPIGQLASAVNQGDVRQAHSLLKQGPHDGPLHWHQAHSAQPKALAQLACQGRSGSLGGYGQYIDVIAAGPQGDADSAHAQWVHGVLSAFDRMRVLCAVREGPWGVSGLNALIEAALRTQGVSVAASGQTWFEGRPVVVTRNDPGLGVFNGDIGMALRSGTAPGAPLRVYFPQGEQLRSISPQRLPDVETAYAMTVHKAQGSEFAHTLLVLPPTTLEPLSRELMYTAVTRAKTAFTLVTPEPQVWDSALVSPTRRESGLQLQSDM